MSLLVVLDVDSTLIQQEVIELIAANAGVMEQVKEITDRAMAGELDFAESLKERVALLKGIPVSSLAQVYEQVTVTPGVEELIAAVHSSGGRVGAVSGGFVEILEPLAKKLGLDYYRANALEAHDGVLTGKTVGQVIDRAAKAAALIEWAKDTQVEISGTVAIGDGANDIDMLEAAGFAIAFRPKAILREYADFVIEENSLASVIEQLRLSAG